MSMERTWITVAASLVLATGLRAQLETEKSLPPAAGRSDAYGYPAPALDGWQAPTTGTMDRQTADMWKRICESRPTDADAHLNWYRSERNARLQSNNGSLRSADKKALNDIAKDIQATPGAEFQQQLTTYYERFPEQAAFDALDKAAAAKPEDATLIMPKLVEANRNGDQAGIDKGCADAETRGGLSPALLDVASDMLNSVDHQGIVFCNGDMDAYPALVQQRRHAERRDVLVVDQRLLADMGYRQRIWSEATAKGPVSGPGPAFAQTLAASTDRPVFLALSLDPEWFKLLGTDQRLSGIAFKLSPGRPATPLGLVWDKMKKPVNAGVLSQNYLLPGSVLLRDHLAAENESKAASLELELRRIGKATGTEQQLYKAGVLSH
jgi:hypothetical protein